MDINVFSDLGFSWDCHVLPPWMPVHSHEFSCFQMYKRIPEFAWDLSRYENNPLCFSEIKALVDGSQIWSQYPDREEEIVAIAVGIRYLLALVRSQQFCINENTIRAINRVVANSSGHSGFQFEASNALHAEVSKAQVGDNVVELSPISNRRKQLLNERIFSGLRLIENIPCSPFQKAAAIFLLGEVNEVVEKGNRTTIQLIMNGVLISAGIDPISIPFARSQEYSDHVDHFHQTKDGSLLIEFLVSCHPAAKTHYRLSPRLPSCFENQSTTSLGNLS